MKEYENGFTTKAMLDENNGNKSSYGEQIKVSTKNGSIVMCVLGDDFEFVHMNVREAKKLRDILNEAIKKVI